MSKDINWTQFFKEAGVPLSIAKRYAATFEDNRISKDMLMDLNKEILTSMGITAMGDVINILRQAKKTYSQDMKKKDIVSPASKTVVPTSNKRPPPPAAHSTTAGQAPTVSTTSASTKKNIASSVAKNAKKEVPDSPQEVAYVSYISNPDVKKSVVLESEEDEDEYYVASTESHEEKADENNFQESYQTQHYEAKKLKRPMTMYSDDKRQDYPQPKQPRVIILPGERQDIFTTSGLQKAAKVYESGEEQEGKLTTDRSRRLLESAGLIPTKDKSPGHSIFSRLDYKPSITSHAKPLSTNPAQKHATLATEEESRIRRRIINLSKTSSSSEPSRTITSTLRKISSLTSPRKVGATSSSRSRSSSSLPSKVVSREETRPVAKRLGDRFRTASNPEKTRVRDSRSIITSTISRNQIKLQLAESHARRSGLYGSSRSDRSKRGSPKVHSSMVADEYEYQTHRQHDIRSRLEVKELEKAARRGGPLVGRLGSHKVFRRLE